MKKTILSAIVFTTLSATTFAQTAPAKKHSSPFTKPVATAPAPQAKPAVAPKPETKPAETKAKPAVIEAKKEAPKAGKKQSAFLIKVLCTVF